MHPLFDQRRYLIPFRSSLLPQIFTDTLVIGAGVAGLRAAIAAAGEGESRKETSGSGSESRATGAGDVIVLMKEGTETSNTAWAQGGIACVMSEEDSIESHVRDTVEAGAGLCDDGEGGAVRTICSAGPARMRELIEWGLRVDRGRDGGVALGLEAAHSHSRIIHADGDATGRELVRCLVERARTIPTIRMFTRCFALDLITPSGEPGAPVMGAITHHPRYGLQMIWAKTTILASGGAGMVYRETTNPRAATADGVAMAYRAGASAQDMAFIQFHPTTLYLAGAPRSLISEAVRGEGGILVDESGHRFMPELHPRAELAPRDVVSRAIVRRIAGHGGTHVNLDVRHIPNFAARFPGIVETLARYDLDPAKDLIPVNPACHYTIGGIVTDAGGRTDVPGLFAAGEVASTGLHGANRLASNSLLEGLVMGEASGRAAREIAKGNINGSTGWSGWRPAPSPVAVVSDIRPSEQADLDLADVLGSLRSAMWRNAGIERSGPRLADVCEMIDFWARYTLDKIFDSEEGWQTQNLLLTAALIARSAAWRAESRGAHWRSDAPEPSERFRVHDRWRRGSGKDGGGDVTRERGPTIVPVGVKKEGRES